MENKTNKLSVAAIILAVFGICGAVFLGWLTIGISAVPAILGLIFSIVAKKKNPEDKLAKAAFIISLIAIIIGILLLGGCVVCNAVVFNE